MLDDDIFSSLLNSYSGTTTETETNNDQQNQTTTYNPQQQTYFNPYSQSTDDYDDYSTRQNYVEQQNYNSTGQNYGVETQQPQKVQTYEVRQMNAPLLEKDEPAVTLVKSRARVELQARMKIAISMFAIIVSTLLFAIIWNFVSASKMKSTFVGKQYEIEQLQQSITAMKQSYIELSNDQQIKTKAEEAGFVEKSNENTIEVRFDEGYVQAEKEMSSNWFNDVCDFLSGIFG